MGVGKGDRVIIYMPMVPEAVVAMLACARLGAVHSVVFGGFAANELAVRINDAEPKVIISASCGIEVKKVIEYKPLLDEAIRLARHKPERCLIFQRPMAKAALTPGLDVDWNEAMAAAKPHECVPVSATDPLYILYTSGTTGQPKGVVRDTGGHIVALQWTMNNIYDCPPGSVFWAASDIGWVVGHSYIVYGPLFNGNTTVLYEGKPVGTPDPGAFWRVISQHKVRALFTAPTAFRAIKRDDPNGEYLKKYDISCLKTLFLAGERCDPDTLHWAERLLKIPVIDHWWQTETGWAICANCMGIEHLPVKAGSPTRAVPGVDVRVLDAEGQEVERNTLGALVIKLPLPPGNFPTLWQAEERFKKTYLDTFPGYYQTYDAGVVDDDGYVHVMSRTDDIINVAGHRLSTGAMEEVLSSHQDVAECAVIGVHDQLKGQVPLGFLVLKAGVGAAGRRHRQGSRRDGARQDRPGGGVQDRDRHQAAAQDALGQDPARHHAPHRRQRALQHAGDDRRPGDPRGDDEASSTSVAKKVEPGRREARRAASGLCGAPAHLARVLPCRRSTASTWLGRRIRSIGILTSGGDCQGLNAAIRAVAKTAMKSYGMDVVGILDGFRGLVENRSQRLTDADLSDILTLGGTILGTSRDKPNKMPLGGRTVDMTEQAVENYHKLHLDALVCIGGGGTQKNALHLMQNSDMKIVTLPKTIDNDVWGTDVCFGFDTAVQIATDAIDRIHSTASSHQRVMLVEVMGHNTGWIAAASGLAGGADVVLLPELPYSVDAVIDAVVERKRSGKRFSIVAFAEGALSAQEAARQAKAAEKKGSAREKAGCREAAQRSRSCRRPHPEMSLSQRLTRQIEEGSGLETRLTALGHVMRGGTPTAADRTLATVLGSEAARLLAKGVSGVMVGMRGQTPVHVELAEVAGKTTQRPPRPPLDPDAAAPEHLPRGLSRALSTMVSRTTPPARAGSLARIRGFRLRDILIGVFLVLAVWTLLPRRQQEVRNIDTPGRAMVCFGDSLTAGVGARPGEDIASRLGAALGRAVVNAGVSGDTTSDALARVAADVLVHRPGIVVINAAR